MFDFDVMVVGGGAAGFVACKLANGLGERVAMVEKDRLGGDCTLYGCIPSKALIRSAAVMQQTRDLERFGLRAEGVAFLDTSGVMTRVRDAVERVASTHPAESFEAQGIRVLFGQPRFLDPYHIRMGDRTFSARRFILCTGSSPSIPPVQGLEGVRYLTNRTLYSIESLPKSMIVLGAGPIGTEMAAALNRLGVRTIVVEQAAGILGRDDRELAEKLTDILRQQGVEILLETRAVRFREEGGRIVASLEGKDGRRELEADALLVAVGRTVNVDNLDLEKAGVEYGPKGVKVDRHLRTTASNIYAAGDIVPPYLFSHIAEHEAVTATVNACAGLPIRRMSYNHVIWTTFTEPELAHAGLTEEQAREQYGDSIQVYRWQYSDVDRARTDVTETGLGKFICDRKGRLVGAHILGHGATEVLHEAQLAKTLGTPFKRIAQIIHAYPSYSDVVRQPAKRCYANTLRSRPFVRLLQRLHYGRGLSR